MALTSNIQPAYQIGEREDYPVRAATRIYEGSNSRIGHVSRWESGTTCVVEFDARGI